MHKLLLLTVVLYFYLAFAISRRNETTHILIALVQILTGHLFWNHHREKRSRHCHIDRVIGSLPLCKKRLGEVIVPLKHRIGEDHVTAILSLEPLGG